MLSRRAVSIEYLADWIRKSYNWGLPGFPDEPPLFGRDRAGALFYYDTGEDTGEPGYYPAEDLVHEALIDFRKRQDLETWSTGQAKAVTQYLAQAEGTVLIDDERSPEWVCLRNGGLNLDTGEFREHGPRKSWTRKQTRLPLEYDPDADCPAVEKFVAETFPRDAAQVAWELFAWLLDARLDLQKALLLLGEGGTGKSRFLALVRAFCGEENTAALTLHQLESDRFALAGLFGKLANVCGDLPRSAVVDSSAFKMLTGGDLVTAARKFLDPIQWRPRTRLLFSANRAPRGPDPSDAYFDRWVVLPFVNRFRGTDQEVRSTELDARLCAPEELSGVLNRALAALDEIRARGLRVSPSMLEAAARFRRETEPVAGFLESRVAVHPAGWVSQRQLYAAYQAETFDQGGPAPETAKRFAAAVRRRWPGIAITKRRVDGIRQRAWNGIFLRAEGCPDVPEAASVHEPVHERRQEPSS